MERLAEKINNRIVCILSHGKSIENLEKNIYELEKYDICWASYNDFTILEKNILDKINRKLDIVLDNCDPPISPVMKIYEETMRIPAFEELIERNSILISRKKLIQEDYKLYGFNNFIEKYNKKIIYVEDIFTKEILFLSPSSFSCLIASVILGKPKKIIIFGLDGYLGEAEKELESYYKPEEHLHRKNSMGFAKNLNQDSQSFKNVHYDYLNHIRKTFKSPCSIINCGLTSIYDKISTISYSELNNILKEN